MLARSVVVSHVTGTAVTLVAGRDREERGISLPYPVLEDALTQEASLRMMAITNSLFSS